MTAPTDFIDVPSGALCGATVTLTCKGPDEERSYVLEYDSQLDPDDYITAVTAVAGDTAVAITDIMVLGKRFRFTLTGGTLNQKSGIEFTITLKSGDIRTLVCVLNVEAQGVLQTGTVPVIMGPQGARGTQIWFSDSDPTSTFTPPNGVAVNTGDIVYSQASNAFWVASYVESVLTWTKTAEFVTTIDADSVITTETNTATIGNVTDDAIYSKTHIDNILGQIGNNSLYVDQNGVIKIVPSNSGELPTDLTINGEVYMAGATTLPTGLSDNGGVVMTDGSVYFPGTFSNGGVLSVNPNATGA